MYEMAPQLKERIIALVKFSDKKYLESFQKGNLYLNTLEYFQKLEEQAKEKGMGDANEGRLVLTELDIQIRDYETGNIVMEGKASRSALTAQEDSEKHVLCTSYIDFGSLDITEQGEGYIKGKTVFTEEQQLEVRSHFGKYALITFYSDFVNNINKSFKEQGIQCVSNKVKYTNYSINYKDRIESFMGNTSDKYLWKDNYFKDQKEFRLVVFEKDSKEAITIKIDDMTKYSAIIPVEQLFNDGFEIECRFNHETEKLKTSI